MFDLAPTPRYRLARPPLVQAIAQIRYPVRAHLQSLEGVTKIQDDVEALFPYLSEQQVQSLSFLLSPGAPVQAGGQTSKAWQFSDDAGWIFAVSPDNASLTAGGGQYGSFADFAERFRLILSALSENTGVGRCDRLGVRYIDLAEVPLDEDDAWRRWFRPELTGWGSSEVLGSDTTLVASIAQTQLSARPTGELSGPPVDVQAIIRHGYLPPNTALPGVPIQSQSAAFLLDMDLFVEGPQVFDVDALDAQLDILHTQIDRFFRWTLAPEGEEHFGLEEEA
jgi:uncharacterized protein (TIGR04255 family)